MVKKKKGGGDSPILASNRSASHEYHLIQRIECGMVLLGPEVKSARAGKVNLKESYAKIRNGEIFLVGAHFSPYTHARQDEIDPTRARKLLLHAAEIKKLSRELEGTGMTLVPTKMYLKNGRIKLEIALGRGKKLHDKRDSKKKKESDREIARATSLRR